MENNLRAPDDIDAAEQAQPNCLVWADTETTGLHRDAYLLELALVITDDWLRPIGTPFEVVIFQPDTVLAEMDDKAREMHARSGLTEAVRSSPFSLDEAHKLALEYVTAHVGQTQAGLVPLCGSTIRFDRNQLAHWMPELDAFLHHRTIDVSTVKELTRRWTPRIFEGLAAGMAAGVRPHRALPDVLASIAELAYYRDTVFKV